MERTFCCFCDEPLRRSGDVEVCPEHGVLEGIDDVEFYLLTVQRTAGEGMEPVADHSAGARAVSVPCVKCGDMHRLSESTIDPKGPAFKAYWCAGCVPAAATLPRHCGGLGCVPCNERGLQA